MGEPDKVLLVRRGRLGCSRPDDEQALLSHISNAASAARGAAALAPKAAVSLRRSGDKPPLRLLVCPLAQAHPWQTSAGVQAQVALIEMASGHIFATDEARSVLKSAFRLTEAEARLAALLAEGISVEQATAVLGIGRNTAKTQLQAIFHKVLPVTAIPNTYRQPALARILRDCFSVALR